MRTIALTKGFETIVDDDDFHFLSQWKWRVSERHGQRYAVRMQWIPNARNYKIVIMHRLLMNPKDTQEVDHRDRNGLNNQRSNLRVCENWQNHGNSALSVRNTSGFKGVCFNKTHSLWMVTIGAPRRTIGYSHSREEAARMYDREAVKTFGEFALTNKQLGLLIE